MQPFNLISGLTFLCSILSGTCAPIETISDQSDYSLVYNCFYDHSWLWDRSHHCHVVAYGAGKEEFTTKERKLRSMFQEMIRSDQRDRQLVKHCVLYHQFDQNFEPCRGISWDRPKQAKMRDARLVRLWEQMMKATKRQITLNRLFDSADNALVQTCLYTSEWVSSPDHQCHQVVSAAGPKSQSDPHDRKLQQMYKDQRIVDRVIDCHHYHRLDRYEQCYDITWSVRSSQEQASKHETMRKIWNRLTSDNR